MAVRRVCSIQGEAHRVSGARSMGCVQVYKGPSLIPDAKKELLRCLEADGISSVEEAVGADHR